MRPHVRTKIAAWLLLIETIMLALAVGVDGIITALASLMVFTAVLLLGPRA